MSEHPLDRLREATACPHYENVDAALHSGCSWCAHMEEIGVAAALRAVEQLEQAARSMRYAPGSGADDDVLVAREDFYALRAALALFDRKEQT